jgi:hypothetical protein
MSSSFSFTGEGFFVEGATLLSPTSLRVSFSNAPKAIDPLAIDDALNLANFTLSGPGPYVLYGASPVINNPLALDLTLSGPLLGGSWTVTVSSVKTPSDVPLAAPFAATFIADSTAAFTSLNAGAENDSSESIIRKHLSPALKGKNWDALIAALSVGDDFNFQNARLAYDQVFLSTASEAYLERKANDLGISKPPGIGVSDSLFRGLVIKNNSSKVVHESIRQILEVFYGRDSLRAFVESTVDGPYNLSGGPTLKWTLDSSTSFTHTFASNQFGNPSAANAYEIAFALTNTMKIAGSKGYAVGYQSPLTGLTGVRIYSGAIGLRSSVRVDGGDAQNLFAFPSRLNTYSDEVSPIDSYVWSYFQPDQNTTRISLTTNFLTKKLDISSLREGDYVNFGVGAQNGFLDTHIIKAINITLSGTDVTQSFDIEQIPTLGNLTQQNNDAYVFFRPTKNSIFAASGRTAVVSQNSPNRIDISIPATTQIVNRGPKTGAYCRVNKDLEILSISPTTLGTAEASLVTTATPHGLSVGDRFTIQNAVPITAIPTPNTGNGTTIYPASTVSLATKTDTLPERVGADSSIVRLDSGDILFAGGFTISAPSGFTVSDTANCVLYRAGATATLSDGSLQHTHSWINVPNMTGSRCRAAASPYGLGAVVTGGLRDADSFGTSYSFLDGCQYFDATSNSWSTLPNLPFPRAGHCQVKLDNGNLIVIGGGVSTSTTNTSITTIFDGVSWNTGPDMATPRTDFQAVKLSDGRVVVIGGRSRNGAGIGIEHSSQVLSNPQTLATLGKLTNTVEILSADGTTWSSCGSMSLARTFHRAIVLPDDSILVTGGVGYNPSNPIPQLLSSAELFDSTTQTWRRLPDMGAARYLHTLALLPGQVVVMGGATTTSESQNKSIEVFSLEKRRWRMAPASLETSPFPIFGIKSLSRLAI